MNLDDQDGINYTFDNTTFTAIADFSNYKGPENIEVPKCIKYNDQDYTIVSVKNLKQNSNAKSMIFSNDSMVSEIYKISVSSIKIPPLIEKINSNSFSDPYPQSIEFCENSKLNDLNTCVFKNSNLSKIVIPSSVKIIRGSNAMGRNKFEDIEFPPDSKLQIIGYYAFFSMPVKKITIPSSVKEIKSYAFYHCNSLYSIEFPKNSELRKIERDAFYGISIRQIRIPSQVECIGDDFYQQFDIIDVDEDNQHFTSINGLLLYHKESIMFANRNLTSVSIPSYIKEISYRSFSKMVNLKEIEFPEDSSIELIDRYSFNESGLERIKFSKKLRNIGDYAFENCQNLKYVDFDPNSELCVIGSSSFKNTAIESIEIPSNVIRIEGNSFENCQKLHTLIFSKGSNLLSIGNYSFQSSSITKIVIPASVQQIGVFAFNQCENLQIVEFADNSDLRIIDDSTFNSAKKLEAITIPSKVCKIGKSAFENCSKLKIVVFSSNSELCLIDDCAFKNTAIESIKIPPNVKKIGESSFENSQLKTIEFLPNSELKSIGKRAFSNCKFISILIPSSVQKIKNSAFYSCSYLQEIIFEPNSQLRAIGSNAFTYTEIKEFNIPSKVDDIKDGCFYYMSNLESIIVSKDNDRYSFTKDGLLLFKEKEECQEFNVLSHNLYKTKKVVIPPYVNKLAIHSLDECYTLNVSKGSKLNYINNDVLNSSYISTIILPIAQISVLSSSNRCSSISKIAIIDDNDVIINKLAFDAFSKTLVVSFINAQNIRISKGCKKMTIILPTKANFVCEDSDLHEIRKVPRELLQENKFPSEKDVNNFYIKEYEKNH